jgi:hypothetical protein
LQSAVVNNNISKQLISGNDPDSAGLTQLDQQQKKKHPKEDTQKSEKGRAINQTEPRE